MASWLRRWNLNPGGSCWKPLGGSKVNSGLWVPRISGDLVEKNYLVIVTLQPWSNWTPSINRRQIVSIRDVPTNANLFTWRKWSSYSNWQFLKLVNVLRRTVHKNSRIHNILNSKFKSIIISIWPNYSWITTLVYLIIKNFQCQNY